MAQVERDERGVVAPSVGPLGLAETADVLAEFLEAAIHLILYVREVYPAGKERERETERGGERRRSNNTV